MQIWIVTSLLAAMPASGQNRKEAFIRLRNSSKTKLMMTRMEMRMMTTMRARMMMQRSWCVNMRNSRRKERRRSIWRSLPRWRRSNAGSKRKSSTATPCSILSSARPPQWLEALLPTKWSASGTKRPCLGTMLVMSRKIRSASSTILSGATSTVASSQERFNECSSDVI